MSLIPPNVFKAGRNDIAEHRRELPTPSFPPVATLNPQTIAKAIQHFLPSKLPPTLSSSPSFLFQVLSRFLQDGVGQKIYQTRWGMKGFPECYQEVTRTKPEPEGRHGNVWGHLVWRGTLPRVMNARTLVVEYWRQANGSLKMLYTLVRGGPNYKWATGASASAIAEAQTASILNFRLEPGIVQDLWFFCCRSQHNARYNLVHLTAAINIICSLRAFRKSKHLLPNRGHASQTIRPRHPLHSRSLRRDDRVSSH